MRHNYRRHGTNSFWDETVFCSQTARTTKSGIVVLFTHCALWLYDPLHLPSFHCRICCTGTSRRAPAPPLFLTQDNPRAYRQFTVHGSAQVALDSEAHPDGDSEPLFPRGACHPPAASRVSRSFIGSKIGASGNREEKERGAGGVGECSCFASPSQYFWLVFHLFGSVSVLAL